MSDASPPDPLDVLRPSPHAAAPAPAPTPEFTARLRARIERALMLPRGVTVSDLLDPEPATTPAAGATSGTGAPPATEPYLPLVPYLAVEGARAAIDFYGAAFGARPDGDPYVMPDGRIGHAELVLPGGARLMLSDQYPEIGVVAPLDGAGSTVTLHLSVRDVDATLAAAVRAGARLERAATDHDYGRNGAVVDPFGHRWMIAGDRGAAPVAPGDIVYASLWVPDADRAARFFGAVLGWRYDPAGGGDRPQVTGQTRPHGILGGVEVPGLLVCMGVDDLDAALARVGAAGGTTGDPVVESFGRVAMCTDDQGMRFALWEVPAGADRPPADETHNRRGDLAYVTFEVVDSGRARRFYGAVLGWEFVPGRVDDGWQVVGPTPPAGMSGGHERATTIPMYAVDDIVAAVGAVRAGGGSATDPEQLPYGLSSTCTDDQGTRFSLGQLS